MGPCSRSWTVRESLWGHVLVREPHVYNFQWTFVSMLQSLGPCEVHALRVARPVGRELSVLLLLWWRHSSRSSLQLCFLFKQPISFSIESCLSRQDFSSFLTFSIFLRKSALVKILTVSSLTVSIKQFSSAGPTLVCSSRNSLFISSKFLLRPVWKREVPPPTLDERPCTPSGTAGFGVPGSEWSANLETGSGRVVCCLFFSVRAVGSAAWSDIPS